MTQLLDIICIDWLSFNKLRYQLSYFLVSFLHNVRFRVNVRTTRSVPSLGNIYYSALWLEREIWDLFGIFFEGHPDLRRILTDYGFNGFPLRKDYPLIGYYELHYDTYFKCLIWAPVELEQEFRFFDFKSSWLS